jgi:hypothetical protein
MVDAVALEHSELVRNRDRRTQRLALSWQSKFASSAVADRLQELPVAGGGCGRHATLTPISRPSANARAWASLRREALFLQVALQASLRGLLVSNLVPQPGQMRL